MPNSLSLPLFIPDDVFTLGRSAFLKTLGFDVQTYKVPCLPTGITLLKEDPRAFLRKQLHQLTSTIDQPYMRLYTGIFCGRRLLGQPTCFDEAIAMVKLLSGRRHRLYTIMGVGEGASYRIEITTVRLKHLDALEIKQLAQAFPLYPCQSLLHTKIEAIMGPPGNLYGIPYLQTTHLLKAAGLLTDKAISETSGIASKIEQ